MLECPRPDGLVDDEKRCVRRRDVPRFACFAQVSKNGHRSPDSGAQTVACALSRDRNAACTASLFWHMGAPLKGSLRSQPRRTATRAPSAPRRRRYLRTAHGSG